MLYYKKNGTIFYQFNPSDKSYTELFDNGLQFRMMRIYESRLYDDSMVRMVEHQFEESSEAEFKAKMESIKAKI